MAWCRISGLEKSTQLFAQTRHYLQLFPWDTETGEQQVSLIHRVHSTADLLGHLLQSAPYSLTPFPVSTSLSISNKGNQKRDFIQYIIQRTLIYRPITLVFTLSCTLIGSWKIHFDWWDFPHTSVSVHVAQSSEWEDVWRGLNHSTGRGHLAFHQNGFIISVAPA